jgi:hypothetical protein
MNFTVDFELISYSNSVIHFGTVLCISIDDVSSIESKNPFEIIIRTKNNDEIIIDSLYAPRYDYDGECINIPEGELYYLTRNNNNKIQYLKNLVSCK